MIAKNLGHNPKSMSSSFIFRTRICRQHLLIMKPFMLHFYIVSLGTEIGAHGCNLSVSIFWLPSNKAVPLCCSSIKSFFLANCLISSCTFFISKPLRERHAKVDEFPLLPPILICCKQRKQSIQNIPKIWKVYWKHYHKLCFDVFRCKIKWRWFISFNPKQNINYVSIHRFWPLWIHMLFNQFL